MSKPWEILFDGLKDEVGQKLKEEFTNFISEAKNDSEEFIKKQAKKLEKYMNQLARGEITKTDFEVNVESLEILTRQKALELSIKGKARAQRLADTIKDLILGRLLALLL
jgi:vacuolar-type H+-ATPase subunit H